MKSTIRVVLCRAPACGLSTDCQIRLASHPVKGLGSVSAWRQLGLQEVGLGLTALPVCQLLEVMGAGAASPPGESLKERLVPRAPDSGEWDQSKVHGQPCQEVPLPTASSQPACAPVCSKLSPKLCPEGQGPPHIALCSLRQEILCCYTWKFSKTPLHQEGLCKECPIPSTYT